jgi:hypothetical protein
MQVVNLPTPVAPHSRRTDPSAAVADDSSVTDDGWGRCRTETGHPPTRSRISRATSATARARVDAQVPDFHPAGPVGERRRRWTLADQDPSRVAWRPGGHEHRRQSCRPVAVPQRPPRQPLGAAALPCPTSASPPPRPGPPPCVTSPSRHPPRHRPGPGLQPRDANRHLADASET